MSRLLLLNKPFGVLCQFSGAGPTLAALVPQPEVYPAGRLDKDSEGLLLLTDDGALQARISSPRFKLPKTYWAQVEGVPDDAALRALTGGVDLREGRSAPAEARPLADPALWPREPPIRSRRHQPTSWIELVLREGRNRQVRRMTAAVGHPTLRLVRVAIGPLRLGDLAPGAWRAASAAEMAALGPSLKKPARRPVPPADRPGRARAGDRRCRAGRKSARSRRSADYRR